DVDGTVDNFRVDILPANGTLYLSDQMTLVVAGDPIPAAGNAATLYFVPDENFNGDVSFNYVAIDNNSADSAAASVDITVDPVNDAPVANDQVINATEDGGEVGPFFFNADDLDGDDDQTTLNYTILTVLSAQGVINASVNLFTYDPGDDFQYLAEDEVEHVYIDYKATDSHATDSNVAIIDVVVTGVNDAPIAVDDSYTATIDPNISGNVITNINGLDTDPDNGAILTVYAVNGNTADVGEFVSLSIETGIQINSDGSFDYSGIFGHEDILTYTITDEHGALSTATITLTVPDEVAPMILDLNNNQKIDLIDSDKSAVMLNSFDDTHGTNHMGWVKPGDGILVYDYQGDGKVSNIDEIALTLHSDAAKTDLDALRIAFDTNHDGVFDAKDEQFNKFGVWQDKNGDGISDAGEYHTLSQMGILSIKVTSDHHVEMIEGNTVYGYTTYQTVDGQSHLAGDVGLNVAPATKSVAISEPDVFDGYHALDFSSVANSLPPLAYDQQSATNVPAPQANMADVTINTANDTQLMTQHLEQQHQETPLS
ncbi:MAG: Ig-like domain-containing protein, partial [Candidatus Berkiella sp.]